MENGNETDAPQSLAEVEGLIKRFYSPGPAKLISSIDSRLRQLQTSQYGWELADSLMASGDANVRFFAANTFIVKLNDTRSPLDAVAAQDVQRRLMHWLVTLILQDGGGIACEKLCVALTTYYNRTPVPWKSPLLHLALSFFHGGALSAEDLETSEATMPGLLPSLNSLQLQALLWFTSSLAEGLYRVPDNNPSLAHLHYEMEKVVVDARTLMHWCFVQPSETANHIVTAEAFRTYPFWIRYAQPIHPRSSAVLQSLRDLIIPASQCLLDDDLQAEALESFKDLLDMYPNFFLREHMVFLSNFIHEHVRPMLLQALNDPGTDKLILGQFVIGFGLATMEQVVENPDNELRSQEIIELHLEMLSAKEYPGDDDGLLIESLEFWSMYTEHAIDVLFSKDEDEPDPDWLGIAKSVLHHATERIWKKMWWPPNEVAAAWGDEEIAGLNEFRKDSKELFILMFTLRGKEILRQLVNLTLESLQAHEWRAVEAALFSLNALSDSVLDDATNEESIGEIFNSNLFVDVANLSLPIPSKTRFTAINTLGSYGQYIERHPVFLEDTLRFLFVSLALANLANGAAKSIESLCSTCRMSLIGALPGLLDQYQRFLGEATSTPYTKQKFVGAIAAVIQSLKSDVAKAEALRTLLTGIENDAAEAKRYADMGDMDMAEEMGVSSLECLAKIGKAMQVPEDVPIVIDEDGEESSVKVNYWESEDGGDIQRRIVNSFLVLKVVGTYSAAVDAACQVLRSGFTETEPGPFVLPPSVTVEFLRQCSIHTPNIEKVISTACILITQHSRSDSKRIDGDVRAIYDAVAAFMQALGQPNTDSFTATECINVLSRLMPYYTHVLLEGINAVTLDFTLAAIEGPDSDSKSSSCDFWVKLIKPQSASTSPEVQQRLNQLLQAYGPKLSLALIRQIGGQAVRSDIKDIYQPLKALLLHQSGTKLWLQDALTDPSFPSIFASLDDRARFLRQLVSVRSDGLKIKELVTMFWAKCAGTVASFSS